MLEIDVNGGLAVKKSFPEVVLIFVTPPSKDELVARLKKRNTESDALISERVDRISYEMEMGKEYDYFVINDDLKRAIKEVENIVKKEKNKDF